MSFAGGMTLIVVLAVIVLIVNGLRRSAMTPEQRKEEDLTVAHGPTHAEVICPHCQVKGTVRVKVELAKAGISGAKATGALLTGGISLVATGLSRKEEVRLAHCCHCEVTWRL